MAPTEPSRRTCGTSAPKKTSATALMGLRGPSRARKAAPTTTVGSTNGTTVSARATRLPGNSKRAKTHAEGNPSSSVNPVDTAASASVNSTVSSTNGCNHASTTPPSASWPSGATPRARMLATGHTKKRPRKASGGTASSRAQRRVNAGRCRSTRGSRPRGPRRWQPGPGLAVSSAPARVARRPAAAPRQHVPGGHTSPAGARPGSRC